MTGFVNAVLEKGKYALSRSTERRKKKSMSLDEAMPKLPPPSPPLPPPQALARQEQRQVQQPVVSVTESEPTLDRRGSFKWIPRRRTCHDAYQLPTVIQGHEWQTGEMDEIETPEIVGISTATDGKQRSSLICNRRYSLTTMCKFQIGDLAIHIKRVGPASEDPYDRMEDPWIFREGQILAVHVAKGNNQDVSPRYTVQLMETEQEINVDESSLIGSQGMDTAEIGRARSYAEEVSAVVQGIKHVHKSCCTFEGEMNSEQIRLLTRAIDTVNGWASFPPPLLHPDIVAPITLKVRSSYLDTAQTLLENAKCRLYLLRTRCYMENELFPLALDDADQILLLWPDNKEALSAKIQALKALGRDIEAAETFRKARELDEECDDQISNSASGTSWSSFVSSRSDVLTSPSPSALTTTSDAFPFDGDSASQSSSDFSAWFDSPRYSSGGKSGHAFESASLLLSESIPSSTAESLTAATKESDLANSFLLGLSIVEEMNSYLQFEQDGFEDDIL